MTLFLCIIDIFLFLVDFSWNKRISVFEKVTKNHQFYFQFADGGLGSPIIAKVMWHICKDKCAGTASYFKRTLVARKFTLNFTCLKYGCNLIKQCQSLFCCLENEADGQCWYRPEFNVGKNWKWFQQAQWPKSDSLWERRNH